MDTWVIDSKVMVKDNHSCVHNIRTQMEQVEAWDAQVRILVSP